MYEMYLEQVKTDFEKYYDEQYHNETDIFKYEDIYTQAFRDERVTGGVNCNYFKNNQQAKKHIIRYLEPIARYCSDYCIDMTLFIANENWTGLERKLDGFR